MRTGGFSNCYFGCALAKPELVNRLNADAEVAVILSHPNIMPINEAGEHQGQHYFRLGLIEGPTLREALRILAESELVRRLLTFVEGFLVFVERLLTFVE